MISGVQILRGLAAIMVVFAHLQSHLHRFDGAWLNWLSVGVSGVDVFFVISGFIIWLTSQSPQMTAKTFFFRRTVRIIPLYWLVTGFLVVAALVVPSLMNSTVFQLTHVIASFGFIPYPHPVLRDAYPILVPGWSLNYEMFFYLLFGLALFLRNRLQTLLTSLGILTVLVSAGFWLRPANYILYFYTDPIILEFAFGLLIGVLYTHGPKVPLSIGTFAIPIGILGIAAAGAADLVNDHHTRFLAVGIPSALLVFGVTVLAQNERDIRSPLFVALGDASYSIYLTHVIVVPAGVRFWSISGFGYGWPQMIFFVIAEMTLAIAVGWIVHRLVERPLLEFVRNRAKNDKPADQSAVGGLQNLRKGAG